MKVFRKVDPGRQPRHRDPRGADPGRVRRTSRRSTAGSTLAADGPRRPPAPAGDAPAVPAHRQRRLGPGAGQRPQPVRRGRPARRRGGRRLRRRGGPARRGARRGPRRPGRALPDRGRGADDLAALADAMAEPARRRRWSSCPSWPTHEADAARASSTGSPTLGGSHGPAHPRRPAPRPDPAHRRGLEDRRLRGRAGQAAGRAGPARTRRGATSPGMLRSFDYAPRVVELHRGRRRPGRGRAARATAPASGRSATATPSSTAYAGRDLTADEQDAARRRTSPTRPSTRPSTKPATGRPGSASRSQAIAPMEASRMNQPLPRRPARTRAARSGASTATRTPSSARTPTRAAITVRVLKPLASSVAIRYGDTRGRAGARARGHLGRACCRCAEVPDYRLAVAYDGDARTSSTTPTASCPPSARSTCT